MTRKKFFFSIFIAVMMAFLMPTAMKADGVFAGGDGSSETPFLLSTCQQLQDMDADAGIYLDKHYKLINDIDCSMLNPNNTDVFDPLGTWGDGKGFIPLAPIAGMQYGFRGVLDGDGYAINDFYINRPGEDKVALFARLNDSAEIKNISFGSLASGKAYVNANSYVSIIASDMDMGDLKVEQYPIFSNVSVYGDIYANGDYVGSLISYTDGEGANISNSFFEGNIYLSSGIKNAGGFGGQVHGFIDSSYFKGGIYLTDHTSDAYVGGLVGYTYAALVISNSYAEADIEVVGASVSYQEQQIGGLVGRCSPCTVSDSYFKGAISSDSMDDDIVGGLLGFGSEGTTISNSYVEADINANAPSLGGLVGRYYGTVTDSHFIGSITSNASMNGYVGGLIGEASFGAISIFNSFVEADIIVGESTGGDTAYLVGGLAGIFQGPISGSHFIGSINATVNNSGKVGGLTGEGTASGSVTISNSYVEADITVNQTTAGQTADAVGGLTGQFSGPINESYFRGNIDLPAISSRIGGLMGFGPGVQITNSYSSGNISGAGYIGGITGYHPVGLIEDSYSRANITVKDGVESTVGGIIGFSFSNTISRNYYAGTIVDNSSNSAVYTMIGSDEGTGAFTDNYFDISVSGIGEGGPEGFVNLTGTSTSAMKSLSTYTNWDLATINNHTTEVWYINEGYDYPRLSWQDKVFYIDYRADSNGTLGGETIQEIVVNQALNPVTANADSGFSFTTWSDESTANPRTDTITEAPTDNIVLIASFTQDVIEEEEGAGGGNGGGSISAPICTEVVYGSWSECNPLFDVQMRKAISQSPSGCYLAPAQSQLMMRKCVKAPVVSNEENLREEVLTREKSAFVAKSQELVSRLKGRILLQVENKGEAWYVNPDNQKKHYLARPLDAFNIMRTLGLGISNANLTKFQKSGVPKSFAGKIFLQVEAKGEAYYVNPLDLSLNYLGRPQDAFNLMRTLGLGITNDNLRQIEVED